MKNFISNGGTVEFTAPVGGVVSGVGYVIGSLFVVAALSVAAGERFNGDTHGVFEFDKTAADAPAEGVTAYWNAGTGEVTTTAGGNTQIGVFTEARINGDTKAEVRLDGVSV